MIGESIVSRDAPPTSSIRTVESDVNVHRQHHGRQRPKRRDVARRVVEKTLLSRDNLVERRGKHRLITPPLTPAVIPSREDDADEKDERDSYDADVSPREERV